jgi:hypothetical protein
LTAFLLAKRKRNGIRGVAVSLTEASQLAGRACIMGCVIVALTKVFNTIG